jgi:hypothetical protein
MVINDFYDWHNQGIIKLDVHNYRLVLALIKLVFFFFFCVCLFISLHVNPMYLDLSLLGLESLMWFAGR